MGKFWQLRFQLGIFLVFQTVVFQIKNNKHMLKYFGFQDYLFYLGISNKYKISLLKLFGGENDLQKYSTDILIWITSLSKKNYIL